MNKLHKGEIPLSLLLIPFLAGLAVAAIYPLTAIKDVLVTFFCFSLCIFISLNFFYKYLHVYKFRWMGGLLIYLLLFLSGILCLENNRQLNRKDYFSKLKGDHLIATVSSEPKIGNNFVRFTANVKQVHSLNGMIPAEGRLLVYVRVDGKTVLAYGDELLLPVNYTATDPPFNPAEFDYKAYLAHQNIGHQAFVSPGQIVVLAHDRGNTLVGIALKIRQHLVEKLKSNIHDTDAVAVASTILLGYRADLRKEVQETYAKTGTMHLLAVSGMHVLFIYGLISFILSFLPVTAKAKILKAILSILLIGCYALITGFSPAVCRAALMLAMVITGTAFSRHISRLNLLAFSAFVLLLYNPFYITDVGFQLSYLAVSGIIIIQPLIYKLVDIKNKWIRELWLVFSVSASAQIILFPISAFYFHDFPVYFLISNIFVVIPAAIVMYGGILYLLLPQIPVVSQSLAWLIQKTIIMMNHTLSTIEHAPFGTVGKIWFTRVESVLIFLMIVSYVVIIYTKKYRMVIYSLMLTLVIIVSLSFKNYRSSVGQSITFFSLNKNTSILFKSGRDGIVLSDLKPSDKAYQYSIQACLDSNKIDHINVLSPDRDTATNVLVKKGHLLQFRNIRLLMIDQAYFKKSLSAKINVDYIYITGNPDINLHYLTKNYNFKLIIIAGDNRAGLISKLTSEANTLKIKLSSLKRNKAIVFTSNI